MAASFNKVILAGNLTKDPEIRDVEFGGKEFSVSEFTLAVNRRGKNASQDADFFTVQAYNGVAEALVEHKGKGDALLIDGSAMFKQWEDKETGANRSRIVIAAGSIQYIDSAGRGINKVYLGGNITRDPELGYLPSGTQVAEFGLAVNRIRTDGVDFFDVSAFEDLAGIIYEHKVKGDGVIVEGRLKNDVWEDRETGDYRSKVSVVAQDVQFTFLKDGQPNAQQGQQAPKKSASRGSANSSRGSAGSRPGSRANSSSGANSSRGGSAASRRRPARSSAGSRGSRR